MTKARSRWNALVAALAGSALVALGAQPAVATPYENPTPPAVAEDGTDADYNTAEDFIDYTSHEPGTYFVRLRTENTATRAFAAAHGLEGEEAERVIEQVAQDTRDEIEAKIDQITELVPEAEEVFQLTNSVPGVALDATGEQLAALANHPQVAGIEPIRKVYPMNGATTASTHADLAWTAGKLGEGALVAVVDSGIDYTHKTFGGDGNYEQYRTDQARKNNADSADYPSAVVIGGRDFAGDGAPISGQNHHDNNPLDAAPAVVCPNAAHPSGGHGTHVAATIAGRGVNADGSTFTGDYATLTPDQLAKMKTPPGMAPKARLLSLRIFGCSGGGYSEPALDWLLAPERATEGTFPDVVNMSLGSPWAPHDDIGRVQVRQLTERGALVVVSAGNDGNHADIGGFPAGSPYTLTVGATRYDNGDWPQLQGNTDWEEARAKRDMRVTFFTSRGKHGSHGIIKPDVAAPGAGITSAAVGTGDGSVAQTGTSMAAPVVAGAAAVLAAAQPTWEPKRLKAALMNSAVEIKDGVGNPASPIRGGAGLVNIDAATKSKVIATSRDNTDLVSLTFGIVDVPAAGWSKTKEVVLQNLTNEAQELDLSYRPAVDMAGVNVTVEPAQVTVPAPVAGGSDGSVTVSVKVEVTDPSVMQRLGDGTEEDKLDYVTQEAGWLVGTGAQNLRLPVHVAPRPASDVTVAKKVMLPFENAGASSPVTMQAALTGDSISTGSGKGKFENFAITTRLLVERPVQPAFANSSQAAMDIVRVGIATNLDDMIAAGQPDNASVLISVETSNPWDRLGTDFGRFHVKIDRTDAADNGDIYHAVVKMGGDKHTKTFIHNKTQDDATRQADPKATLHPVATTELFGLPQDSDMPVFDSNVVGIEVPLRALGYTAEQINNRQVAFGFSVAGLTGLGSQWVPDAGSNGMPPVINNNLAFAPDHARILAPEITRAGNYAVPVDGLSALPIRAAGPITNIRLSTFFTRNLATSRIQSTQITRHIPTVENPTMVTPLAPEFVDPDPNTAEGDKIVIPNVTGVVYRINDQIVTGDYTAFTRGEVVVVTAEPAHGYAFTANSPSEWSHVYLVPADVATPVAPTFVDPDKTTAEGDKIVIPIVPGVVYLVDGQEVSGDVYNVKRGEETVVTAVPKGGFVFTPGSVTTWRYTYAPVALEVAPEPPRFVDPNPATADGDMLVIPSVDGVIYKIGGTQVTGNYTSFTRGTPIVVKAEAKPGYALDKDKPAEWSFTFPVLPKVATPTAPRFVDPNPATADGDMLVIPNVPGVVYKIAGREVSGNYTSFTRGTPIVVKAEPKAGYVLAPTAQKQWSFTFPVLPVQPPSASASASASASVTASAAPGSSASASAKPSVTATATATPKPTATPEPTATATVPTPPGTEPYSFGRLAGSSRYGTSMEIAAAGTWGDTVVLASGANAADALAATPLAAALKAPVILTPAGTLDPKTTAALTTAKAAGAVKVLLVGGYGTISRGAEHAVRDMGFTVERLQGGNRFETAQKLADRTRDVYAGRNVKVGRVVLVDGTNFADALAGGPVAAAGNGVVLLTNGKSMPSAVAAQVRRLGAPEVVVLGGAAAAAAGDLATKRVVGADRYDTAVRAAEQFIPNAKSVLVASGESYPDALSGGALMAQRGGILLLTPKAALSSRVSTFLGARSFNWVRVAGGDGAVSNLVAIQLQALTRP
ncbi:cell wall-binding repeat-containing protein [Buchananella felis]|uniref:S8 family serine peptidase n=1 Tax=Buchananella felis TaxID=3231492 RepID=UPI003529BDED